jgi:WD40 repeat protein
LNTTSDSIYELRDNITHIPSIGDPYAMNSYKQTKTDRTKKLVTKIDVFDAQKHKKELKNSVRTKAEKKKEEKLVKQTKKIHVSFACFSQETKKLCIALVDQEIRIYNVKENGKRIKLEENPLSFRSKEIVTFMEITKFVVNDRQILVCGTDVGTIEIYYLDETQKPTSKESHSQNYEGYQSSKKRDVMLKSTLMRNFSIEPGRKLQIVKLKYAKDIGLIVCALNDEKAKGVLYFFDSVDFKKIGSYEDDIISTGQDKFRINISCMDHSETNGLIALGGTEGNMIMIDCAALKVVNSAHSHSVEIIQIYFYDEQHQIISVGKNGVIHIWDVHEMKVLQTFKDGHNLRFSMFDCRKNGTLYTTSQFVKQYKSKVDPEIELKSLQIKILSKDYKSHDMISKPPGKKSNQSDLLVKEVKTSNVLVTENSSLVFVEFLESHNFLVTVDSK